MNKRLTSGRAPIRSACSRRTGIPEPESRRLVDPATTSEIYVFMEAAGESKRCGGAPFRLLDVAGKAGIQARETLASRFS